MFHGSPYFGAGIFCTWILIGSFSAIPRALNEGAFVDGVIYIYVTYDQVEAMTMRTNIDIRKDGFIRQVEGLMNIFECPVNMDKIHIFETEQPCKRVVTEAQLWGRPKIRAQGGARFRRLCKVC